MQNIILDNTSLILLLPLWIFLIIMTGRFFAVYVNKFITYSLTLLGSFLGIILCCISLININNPLDYTFHFIKINNFAIDFGLRVDKLSLIFALILFTISFLVQIFSISYMRNEQKNYRFFALLNLFNFSMAFLLFSPNLFQMYVFWEIVGITSYLLIGFDYQNNIKSIASKRVFLTNRIGDTALISAIILTSYFIYNNSGNYTFTTLSFEDLNVISSLVYAYTSTPVFAGICGLFLIGAAVKSAQFPFHTWLQDAMEAKLPISALLHSATMVAAGVYLAIRLMPFFTLNQYLMKTLLIIGILSAIICSILASCENNPKKILAYSTSANLGLMFFALGIENIKAAIVFFVAHAIIKSMLFLLLPQEEKRMSYLSLVLFILGALSLSGIVFAGYFAKELIYDGITYSSVVYKIFAIISFLTAFYISRLAFLIYKNCELTKRINRTEFIPAAFLMLINICLLPKLPVISLPYITALAGVIAGLALYPVTKNFIVFCIFEKLYNKFLPFLYDKFADLLYWIDLKIFAQYKPVIFLSGKGVAAARWVEANIMDNSVKLTASTTKLISKFDKIIQSKNVQSYNAYALIFITIILSFTIFGYKLIMNLMS